MAGGWRDGGEACRLPTTTDDKQFRAIKAKRKSYAILFKMNHQGFFIFKKPSFQILEIIRFLRLPSMIGQS
jgi:hypothetical protein